MVPYQCSIEDILCRVGGGTHFFIDLGPQFAFLQSAEIDWNLDDVETDMFSFVTLGPPTNVHEAYLQGKGNPEDDAGLFNSFDLLGVFCLGIHLELGFRSGD